MRAQVLPAKFVQLVMTKITKYTLKYYFDFAAADRSTEFDSGGGQDLDWLTKCGGAENGVSQAHKVAE